MDMDEDRDVQISRYLQITPGRGLDSRIQLYSTEV
jgi:hypothetical protein